MDSKLLSDYQNLRFQPDGDYEVRDGSRVVRTTVSDGDSIRLLDILQITFLTSARSPTLSSGRISTDAGVYMAARHFNDRNDSLVPGLADRLAGCDLYVTLEMYDSRVSPIVASEKLFLAHARQHSLQTPVPGGVVGSYSSSVTNPLAILSGSYGTPHVGGVSTAPYLDEKGIYPTYARTTANALSSAKGVIELLMHWKVNRIFCVYQRSEVATSLYLKLQKETTQAGIEIIGTNYESRDEDSADQAIKKIEDSGFHYIVAIISSSTANILLEKAYDRNISGVPDYQWILPSLGTFGEPTKTLDQDESKFAKALDGAATIAVKTDPDPRFINNLYSLRDDPIFQNDYIESHPTDKFVFDNYNWTEFTPSQSFLPYTSYDAFMAIAISACEVDNEFFTPREHWEAMLKTEFMGASGRIAFDQDTAARAFDTAVLKINNIILDRDSIDSNSSDSIRFRSRSFMTVDFARDEQLNFSNPFMFAQNTSEIPSQLPPLGPVTNNIVPPGVQAFGWLLCGLLFCTSLFFGAYTYQNRRKPLIRKSQPIFLGMMCTGTFILASAIIPLSMEYDSDAYNADIACIAVPWLVTMGFSVAFSAIITKIWRINRILANASIMVRVEIRAKDVIWPFVLHSAINLLLLSLLTAVAPLEYARFNVAGYTDEFDRSIATYGICVPSSDASIALLAALGLFNILLIVFANYQCYIGRLLPHNLNEKGYITFTMASLLEAVLIGGPILYFSSETPTADFVIKVVLIVFTCLAILLPTFLPKILSKDSAADVNVDTLHQAMQAHNSVLSSRKSDHSKESENSSKQFLLAKLQGGSNRSSYSQGAASGDVRGSKGLKTSATLHDSEQELASSVRELQLRAAATTRRLSSRSLTSIDGGSEPLSALSVAELQNLNNSKTARKSFHSVESFASGDLELIVEEFEESDKIVQSGNQSSRDIMK